MIKKIFLISIILLICGFSFASVQKEVVYEVVDWSKMLNSHISPYNLPSNQGSVAQNVSSNKRFGSLAKRDTLITLLNFGSSSINGLHRYYKSDTTTYTVAAVSTLLVIDNSGTAQTIQDGLSDGKWWTFVTYNDVMIGANGTNQPIKWDGKVQVNANMDASRTATELCAQLGAPFAELNTGTTLTASKWYQYKMAFYDGTTYTYSTALSNAILLGADVHNITLTDIPLGPTGTTHRYIYRTKGKTAQDDLVSADYYMCIDMSENALRTTNDAVADNSLPVSAPTWTTVSAGVNCTPPIGKYLEIHTQHLFLTGNSTYPSNIYWSDEFNPDYFSATDYERIRPNDGDEITFIKTQLGVLRVGKTNTIQSYYTDGSSSTWYPSDPLTHIGCPAPYSVANTPYGLVYLGRYGIYLFNGQSSSLISDAVTQEIRDISQVNIEECAGYFHENCYNLSYTSTESGSSYNDRVLIYDFIRDAYVLNTENINCFCAFSSGSDLGTLYMGSSTTDGYVVAHSSPLSLQTIRYKSQLDLGTYSSALTTGTEFSPILSMTSLDLMNDYSSDTLARTDWVTSETTEKIPPDIGDGSDGAKTVSADETLAESTYNYTSLTVDAGKTLTITGNTTIKVMGDITVNGVLHCGDATANIYAVNITVSSTGSIIGSPTLKSNTLTVSGAIDKTITLLMHGDTSPFSDSSTTNAKGNATIVSTVTCDTSTKKFGAGSIQAENTSAYLTYADSADWSFGTGDFTIDFWVNHDVINSLQGYCGQSVANNYWAYELNSYNKMRIRFQSGGVNIVDYIMTNAWSGLATGTFYHVELSRHGTNILFFIDGVSQNLTETIAIGTQNVGNVAAIMNIMYHPVSTPNTMKGFFDEFRISKGVCRHTTNFTPATIAEPSLLCYYINSSGTVPTSGDTLDFVNALEVYSESTSKTEGDYSLKFVCANGAITLDDTIANTISSLDLSSYDDVYIDVKSNRTGTNFQLGISDTGAGYTWIDVPVTTADIWETVTLDISSVASASRDAVTIIALKFTNTDATNVLYVDNIKPSITSATWTSPGYLVNADNFDKLYWNESLGTYGNVTFQMRTSPDNATWTDYSTAVTDPTGSDMSTSPAADVYCQFKMNLTTTDGYYTPYLYQDRGYVFKLVYSKIGTGYETSVHSVFQSGWNSLGNPERNKLIQRIRLYYTSDSDSTLSFNIKNQEGNINQTFVVDLSIDPDDDADDFYTGRGDDIVYTFRPSVETPLVGQNWMYTITEDGTRSFRIDKLQFVYDTEELID